MVQAIRERTVVGPSGRIVIDHSDLPEGQSAEVIVLIDHPSTAGTQAHPTLASFIGALKGHFGSPTEADQYVRELRDEWESP